jgi:hypothetical protein
VPVKPRPKPKAVEISSGDRPPSWWEAQADREWRIVVWSRFNADYKAELLRRGPIQTEQTGTIPGDSVVGGFGLAVSCIRA